MTMQDALTLFSGVNMSTYGIIQTLIHGLIPATGHIYWTCNSISMLFLYISLSQQVLLLRIYQSYKMAITELSLKKSSRRSVIFDLILLMLFLTLIWFFSQGCFTAEQSYHPGPLCNIFFWTKSVSKSQKISSGVIILFYVICMVSLYQIVMKIFEGLKIAGTGIQHSLSPTVLQNRYRQVAMYVIQNLCFHLISGILDLVGAIVSLSTTKQLNVDFIAVCLTLSCALPSMRSVIYLFRVGMRKCKVVSKE